MTKSISLTNLKSDHRITAVVVDASRAEITGRIRWRQWKEQHADFAFYGVAEELEMVKLGINCRRRIDRITICLNCFSGREEEKARHMGAVLKLVTKHFGKERIHSVHVVKPVKSKTGSVSSSTTCSLNLLRIT